MADDALWARLESSLFYTTTDGSKVFRWADPVITVDDDPYLKRMRDELLPVVKSEIADAQADAWDEGSRAGWSDRTKSFMEMRSGREDTEKATPNPYRAEAAS